MCGIAGLVGPHDDALPEALAAALAHRGPDDSGIVRDREAQVALVATRLAIVDVASGRQPMRSLAGDATIAFNGEIFNAPELRRELEAEGVRFQTDHSDTEVVLELYRARGIEGIARLNGMFAFAIHDARARRVVVARDRIGIKPLYHARTASGTLAFASELRTLLRVPGVHRELDRQSLFHYLSLRFVPGERSILEGIRRLPAAHVLTLDLDTGAERIEPYWRLGFDPQEGISRAEWTARLREALRVAVERWSLSDVPFACSLSGGLDSSAVVGLLAESGHSDLRTYSLGFSSPDDAGLDELPLARALAARWGTEHHELVADPDELLRDLPAMAWALDEPYGGGLPSWYVFRFMAEDVKVAHTGSGGDELFGNYQRFVPFESGRLARLRGLDARRYYARPAFYFDDATKRELLADTTGLADTAALVEGRFAASGSRSARDAVLYTDVTTQLPDEFLLMTDRFSMAHSLEARTPFLDNDLIELVTQIPPGLRTSAHDAKGLLRDAVGDLLTPAHLAAGKRGFVFPLGRWLRNELRPLAERLLSDEHLRRQGIFQPGLASRLLQPHLDGRVDAGERLWPLLMFQLWHMLYVEEGLTEAPTEDTQALFA